MKRERNLSIEEPDIAQLKAQALGLSSKKRALLERQLTLLRSDLRAAAGSRNRRLVAYVASHKDSPLASGDLRIFLKEWLPDHMVPAAILMVDEIPLTPSGKIDRQRLPAVGRLSLKDVGREPGLPGPGDAGARTPVEETVIAIFEDVLKLDRVWIHDDFFEIGGHSLLATQVVSRVRNAFGVEIGLRAVFEATTVEALARLIEERMKAEDKEEQQQYWAKPGKLPTMNFAAGHPRPQVLGYLEAAKSISLPAELCESLKALSRREGTPLSMSLLTVFKALLYRYRAEADIVLGVATARKGRAEIEAPVGSFVDMLPIWTDLSGNPRFTHLLKRVRGAVLGAYMRRRTPFEKWAADLTLWITEEAEAMRAEWVYRTDLFEEAAIARMHSHFETLLRSIVTRPNAPLDELEMLSEAERERQAASRSIREERNYSKFKSVKPRAIAKPED
jgi:acyl carrier protein